MGTSKHLRALYVILDPRDLLAFGRELLRLAGGPAQPSSYRVLGDRARYRFNVAPEHHRPLYACANGLAAARAANADPAERRILGDVDATRKHAQAGAVRTLAIEALQLEQKRLRDNEYLPGQGPQNPFN